ncbi:MAG TPA: hypothetical protein VMU13_00800 [Candidatus Paceibacterota bacterium]|nr:hypothetical protein [Candidatus Paceibacterota bacterium]
MVRKKIGELVESDTTLATFRRANGKSYCLLPPRGYSYSSVTGLESHLPFPPKQQIEVEVEEKKDGSLHAYIIGEVEDIDPEEEVEVLWEAKPKPKEPEWDDLDPIPY